MDFLPPRLLKVCVPAPGSNLSFRLLNGSAVVTAGNIFGDGHVEVYYEGNKYGASNLQTFAEKASCAADRLLTRYPTVARCYVAWSELLVVGTYDPESRRFSLDLPELVEPWENQSGHYRSVVLPQ